ncbi:MAG: DUF1360 domain-containing protein [Verrucomicrobiota bacterium]|nr:DUF1360 domain-containing protein [Verrucomicrobiota bacterium]
MPAPRKASPAKSQSAEGLFAGYSKTEKPLGGYAALMGLFTVVLSSAVTSFSAEEDPPRLTLGDLLLLGIATHKLSRIVTKDLVTSPFRAPFVKFKKSAGAGEVEEDARGEGLQEAVGDLITCPYCIAPWLATTLVFAHSRAPRATRMICAIFSVTAASDFLNQLYVRAKE